MKNIILLFVILLLSGCDKNPFNTNMKGIGFWESPETVSNAFEQKDGRSMKRNLSWVFLVNHGLVFDGYKMDFIVGMGTYGAMMERIDGKYKSLFRKQDITCLEWNETSPAQAEGSFIFDAPFGQGKVNLHSIKHDGEWVINSMEIPPKENLEKEKPLPLFDYSKAEVIEMLRQPVKKQALKKTPIEAPKIPEPSDDDLLLHKKITGTWEMENEIYAITMLSENGDFQEQIYETKEKKKLFGTVTGKWWITNGTYNYQVTKVVPEMEVSPTPYTFQIDAVTETELIIYSSGGKETKTRIQ